MSRKITYHYTKENTKEKLNDCLQEILRNKWQKPLEHKRLPANLLLVVRVMLLEKSHTEVETMSDRPKETIFGN